MRVFIFEHICGGGLSRVDIRPTLARKGGAMLSALVADFIQAGVQVATCLDRRVTLALEGAQVEPVEPGTDFLLIFDRLARSADAALVVAPEFAGLLEGWTARIRMLGVRSLGSPPEAVALCGDKLALGHFLIAAGVPTPEPAAGLAAMEGRLPLIAKPRYGAGCEDTYLCRTAHDLTTLPQRSDWIVQPLVPGLAASAAFIVHGNTVRPLRAGEQFICGDSKLAYRGGRIPLEPALEARALALGQRALTAVPGLNGYIGVDMVLGDTEGGDHVIEINPRPTVAFVGLRRLCHTSLAAAILDPGALLEWDNRGLSFNAAGEYHWETRP